MRFDSFSVFLFLPRWIKFEEKVEKGGERWSKPHVATLSLHSLFELRTCIEKGTIMLDLEASTLPGVVGECFFFSSHFWALNPDIVCILVCILLISFRGSVFPCIHKTYFEIKACYICVNKSKNILDCELKSSEVKKACWPQDPTVWSSGMLDPVTIDPSVTVSQNAVSIPSTKCKENVFD